MKFTYQLTPDDFTEGIKAHIRGSTSKKGWRVLIALFVFGVASACFFMAKSFFATGAEGQQDFWLSLIGIFSMCGGLSYFLWLPQYNGRKQFEANPSAHALIHLDVDESGLRFAATTGTASIQWIAIVRWLETKRIFSLYSSNVLFQPIPKRAMAREQIAEFRELLQRNIVTRK